MSMGILILEAHIVSAIDQTEYTSLLISFKLQSYRYDVPTHDIVTSRGLTAMHGARQTPTPKNF